MNYQNSFDVICARREDGPALARFFGQYSFEGNIAIAYLRDPDLIESYAHEGYQSVIITVRDKREDGKLIGTGCCIIRKGYVDGKPARIGYLTGLKLLPEYQKKISFIPLVYKELYEQTRKLVDVYCTTILEENKAVWEMLEKKRAFMPEYRFLGAFHTYFCKTGGKKGRGNSSFRFGVCSREEATDFYCGQCEKSDFSVEHGLQDDLSHASFYGVWKNGELAAVGYVLDQRAYKQYVVHHYGGVYRLISKLPVTLLGYPPFPKTGKVANCASAGIWRGRGGGEEEEIVRFLWNGICWECRQFDFLIIGFHQNDIGVQVFSGMKKIDYCSRFYQVVWGDGYKVREEAGVRVEVAFL